MNLYNSLSKNIEEIKPVKPEHISIYSCGPTVYNNVHIGNLASFIYSDTLARTLKIDGYKVKHVMNFTDVDDKTINKSAEIYPTEAPMEALLKLTSLYGDQFKKDIKAIGNNLNNYTFVKATDYINDIKSLITDLLNQGFAYISDDGVYFSIETYQKSGKKYGQLSEITASSTSEARIQNDEYDKESIHDFALWKKQKNNEPYWDFTLDDQNLNGRPGWHIECSVMSSKNLELPFDIHTGGVDLIFPHHENEIAQSTAGQSNPIYAKHFMHSEHLLVNDQKMSKSLNNFITLNDIVQQNFDPLAFRILVMQAHYKSQIHFSYDNLVSAQNRLNDLRAMAVLRFQPREVTHDAGTFALEDVPTELIQLLNDDLDTPGVLAYLSKVSTQLQTVHLERDMIDHFIIMLQGIDDLLGLNLLDQKDINNEQKDLMKQRDQARKAQDWELSDQLRDQLKSQGIAINDAEHGPIWFRL